VQPRDLRKIDSRIPNLVPTILTRKEAILASRFPLQAGFIQLIRRSQVNILHIRALIKADAVVLFDSYGSADSRLHSVFLYHLEVRYRFFAFRNQTLAHHAVHVYSITSRQRTLLSPTSFGAAAV
jgi:magnesium transporter